MAVQFGDIPHRRASVGDRAAAVQSNWTMKLDMTVSPLPCQTSLPKNTLRTYSWGEHIALVNEIADELVNRNPAGAQRLVLQERQIVSSVGSGRLAFAAVEVVRGTVDRGFA